MPSLKELIDDRNKAFASCRKILDGCKTGTLSAEKQTEFDAFEAEGDRLQVEIDARRKAGARQIPPQRPQRDRLAISREEIILDMGKHRPALALKPGTPEHLRATPQYEEAFAYWLTGGQVGKQSLALQVSNKTKGGVMAPTAVAAGIIKFLDDAVVMRQLSHVETLGNAVSLGAVSYDTDYADADWTAEITTSDISEDDAARFGSRELTPHLLTKLVLWSQKLGRSVPSLLSFVQERLGYKFAITENKAFLTGDGAQTPLGVFVADDDGVPTSRDITASAATTFTADNLWEVFFNLKEQYQRNSSWVVSRGFVSRVRRLKDGNGQYLWMPGLNGMPGTICDRPYYIDENAPSTFTASQYVAVLADFKTGYWIADALDMTFEDVSILFTLKNKGGLKGSKETDGMPVLAEAFSRLIMSA